MKYFLERKLPFDVDDEHSDTLLFYAKNIYFSKNSQFLLSEIIYKHTKLP